MSSVQQYRQSFSEILVGYSNCFSKEFGEFYIKHLNNLDISEINYHSEFYLKEIKQKNIPTFEDKLKTIINDGTWKQDEENKLKDYKSLIFTYEQNKSNQHLKSQRDMWIGEIEKLEKEIKELEYKREYLLGDYAEKFSNKKHNELHVLYSFYKEKELKNKLFSINEFENLEHEQVKELFGLFSDYINRFNTEIFQKIALSPFFFNLFNLSSENAYHFYGKPIVQLSFYQIEVYSWAGKFRNDLSNYPHIPPEIMSNPDKLIEYIELNNNYKKNFGDKEQEGGGGSLVGAKKEDYEMLGIKATGNTKLDEQLKKKGGKLSMADLLKMSGE